VTSDGTRRRPDQSMDRSIAPKPTIPGLIRRRANLRMMEEKAGVEAK
jgi:hypothetical protein